MDAPNFVYILALTTIVLVFGFGITSYLRARSARKDGKKSALGDAQTRKPSEPLHSPR